MKKETSLCQSLLAGVVVVALTGCTATSDEVYFGEETAVAPMADEQELLSVDESPLFDDEAICDFQSDDCVESDDYLTTQFIQEADVDVVALSRPAGMNAVSVKDKPKKRKLKQLKKKQNLKRKKRFYTRLYLSRK